MRLELSWSDVGEVTAAPATRLVGKRLEVDLDGLRQLLSADSRLARIRLDLAHPGERCRIGRVFDVIAPRAKADGGADFPGVLGGVARAGHGKTLALSGVAVVATDQQTDNVGTLAVIDMAGPNAALSAFGRTHNLVISAWPSPGTERSDYLAAVRLAALKTAVHLARTARETEPDRVEVFELPPSPRVPPALAHLPRVAYVFQIHSHQRPTGLDEGILGISSEDQRPARKQRDEPRTGVQFERPAYGIETHVIVPADHDEHEAAHDQRSGVVPAGRYGTAGERNG